MTESRRNAVRVTLEAAGSLTAKQFHADCTVEDISVTGARVRIPGEPPYQPQYLPAQLTLTMEFGGEEVSVKGAVARVDRDPDALRLALYFSDGDGAGLGWVINEVQRQDIRAGRRSVVERRAPGR